MTHRIRNQVANGAGRPTHGRGRAEILGVVLALSVATVGCSAKVKQDVFDQTVADLRGEMAELDSRVSDNSNRLEAHEDVLAALRAELSELSADFGDMQAAIVEIEDGLRFVTPVHFDFDRADIRPEDRPLLDRFARVAVRYYPAAIVTVEGFADPYGSADYNQILSERRAQNVADYLTAEAGLPADGIRTAGYGEAEDRQVVPGAQGPGQAGIENRRVTFVIEMGGELRTETVTSREDGGLR